MELFELLAQHPMAFIALTVVYSLLVGSFLNVVIYRLPVMMDREWREQAVDYLHSNPESAATSELPKRFNLVVPRSACPSCKAQITALQNVPVISYLFLRGKCANCKAPISKRYPIVEFATALLSGFVALKFGFTWWTLAGLTMTWCLVALTMIDFDHQLLPDQITLPLVWLGLLINLYATPESPFAPDLRSSVIGGAVGYLSLWSVYWLFKLVTGKEGMGHGDFKLLAAFGTWFGWQPLLLIVLLSSFAGAVIGLGLIVFKGRDHTIPMPYGPFLAIAGWIAMLWSDELIAAYFTLAGIR